MAFDKPTRNRLASFVSDARTLITKEFTQQFQHIYGISVQGDVTPLDQLREHLDDAGLSTATLLRERIEYLIRTHPGEKDGAKSAVDRLAREQAFTVLNRLAALRMAEKRDLIVESVGKGYQSKGFKVYEQVAGSGLGDTYCRYRRYLLCLFDELAVDLGVLFDRSSPQGLLFPREPALLELLNLLIAPELDALWTEDETIGWVYQYYNDPAERKKMRDESAAPRNSRELAVRNQFFTPRYVVEFLTDNTLGRIWYEMTEGETRLKEQCRYLVRRPTEIFLKPNESAPELPPQDGLSQEVLLKQPVYIAHRPLKDPREIRMLDPACGSMHFGLYAFDLFEMIYDEAWEIAHGNDKARKSSVFFTNFVSFAGEYSDKAAFLADVPRLIIEHNIHGIDIDPRCVQIAGLSLWLRAQKGCQLQKLSVTQRLHIRKSNIVCAEPMPGDKAMLREFVQNEFTANEQPAFSRLLETVFEKMQLAGEAGSLLKIEEQIRSAVEEARKLCESIQTKPRELFSTEEIKRTLRPGTQQKLGGLEQAVSQVAKDFWETAEERIYTALRDYAEQTENGGGFQRRLFAEDAARGFAFIDVCRKRYDVALMNPPFGSTLTNPKIESSMPSESADNLYAAFILCSTKLLSEGGAVGCITDRTFLLLPTYQEYRDRLRSGGLLGLADLGWEVLDGAQVATCAYVVTASSSTGRDIWFVDARDESDKESVVLAACSGHTGLVSIENEVFETIPTHPIAHWSPKSIRVAFKAHSGFEPTFGIVRKGLSPGDSERFVKVWWEIPQHEYGLGRRWSPYANGGPFSPFYRATKEVVDWRTNGELIRAYCFPDGRPRFVIRSSELYGTAGLTYGKRGETLNVQLLPAGQVLSNEGYLILPTLRHQTAWPFLAYLNSTPARYLVNMVCGLHKEVGALKVVPVPSAVMSCDADSLADHSRRAFRAARELRLEETNPEFYPHWLLEIRSHAKLREFASAAISRFDSLRTFISVEEKAVDQLLASAFELTKDELASLESDLKLPAIDSGKLSDSDGETDSSAPDELVPDLVSWIAGCAFGRWDIRYATDEKTAPELPDPFASLPVCPPGQLRNAQGLPAGPEDVPASYPLRIPWDGILVDDSNHQLDIERRIREVIEVIWHERAEAIEHEACEILGVKSLRDYFRKPAIFFADHLKRYTKSRRQAPIYWPLSTVSGSYTLWIYYNRLTANTLHTALADFIDPKLKSARDEISYLRNSGNQQARLEELSDLEQELKNFRAEIERIIKLPWKPNLNDGVLITASPLWKLFRLPKWQKDLKACWEALSKGEYDWAHLAYTIWPDRVKEVCKTDRSIAIAHGLEHLCKVKAPKPKVKRKKAKDSSFEDLEA